MSNDVIKHMANRFLGWRLPEDFHPDDGISFEPMWKPYGCEPRRREPTGTNLFNYTQAEAMVRYMIEGIEAYEATRTPPDDVARTVRDAYQKAIKNAEFKRGEVSLHASDWTALGDSIAALQASDNRLVDALEEIATVNFERDDNDWGRGYMAGVKDCAKIAAAALKDIGR